MVVNLQFSFTFDLFIVSDFSVFDKLSYRLLCYKYPVTYVTKGAEKIKNIVNVVSVKSISIRNVQIFPLGNFHVSLTPKDKIP